jgi:hypothetical protein
VLSETETRTASSSSTFGVSIFRSLSLYIYIYIYLLTLIGHITSVLGDRMYIADAAKCKGVWDLLAATLAGGRAGDLTTMAALSCVSLMLDRLGGRLSSALGDIIGKHDVL